MPQWRALRAGTVDDIDARIIAALINDARASYALIGQQVGLSAPAVKRRVDRLRAAGAITGFSARVNPAAMGWTTEAYVELFCGGKTTPEEIGAATAAWRAGEFGPVGGYQGDPLPAPPLDVALLRRPR